VTCALLLLVAGCGGAGVSEPPPAETPVVIQVRVTGDLVGEAIVAGQYTDMSATVLGPGDLPMTDQLVVWSSSDPERATVAGGRVTGLRPGPVIITAASGGKAGTAQLLVLDRPAAEWSEATEWTTHNGNPSHTGFVDATADPARFRLAWEARPFSVGSPNRPATGDGRVYVSVEHGTGRPMVAALDAATGRLEWSVDVGGETYVDAPGFGDGAVFVSAFEAPNVHIIGLDASTGAQRFRSTHGAGSIQEYLAPVEVDGTLFVGGGGAFGLSSFGTRDGTRRWYTGLSPADLWSPSVVNGIVYAYTFASAPSRGVVTAHSAVSGALVFNFEDPGYVWNGWRVRQSAAAGSQDNLLVTNEGRLVSFDLDRREIGWERRDRYNGQVSVANGYVFAASRSTIDIVDERTGNLVRQLQTVSPDEPFIGEIVLTRNITFVCTSKRLLAYDIQSGRLVWRFDATGHLALDRGGNLYVAGKGGAVTAIALR
jgi:outer membrane protein assembly factor BamB